MGFTFRGQFLLSFVISLAIHGSSSADLPTFVKKCPRGDFECARKEAQDAIAEFSKGLPNLQIPSFEPIKMKSVNVQTKNFKLICENFVMTGFSEGRFEEFRLDLDKKELSIKLHAPKPKARCDYDLSGKILILPIEGNGVLSADVEDFYIHTTYPLEIINKDGKEFVKLKDYKYEYDFGLVRFDLTNLFNGNKELSDKTISFMNENWKSVTMEMSGPVAQEVTKFVADDLKKFFNAFSIDQLVG